MSATTTKVGRYTVLGGTNYGVTPYYPSLDRRLNSAVPIVIKCKDAQEAQTAFQLHSILVQLGLNTADSGPELVAQNISQSEQISKVFPAGGPFYAVYNGKTERAIYVRQ
ncbi:hypothetical protein R3P38DRAFT_2791399 [Favolaschia claudopus]|uniref:Uncharacterized protein n=1 Tax=Favolaschia claudopus TaxID=2862362 RepID=A0AAW0AH90_9AGAR